MIFEDSVQIALQVVASCISGVTGFWTLMSPLLGLVNMFLSIKSWQSHNWALNSWEVRVKKIVLTTLQTFMMGFIYYLLFVINAKPDEL